MSTGDVIETLKKLVAEKPQTDPVPVEQNFDDVVR